jgi:hypothetical protein
MQYHYVYILTQPRTGLYYFGVRSCYCLPEEDSYKGSMVSWRLTEEEKNKLNKKIIEVFNTRKEAEEFESCAIESCINDHLNRNWSIPNKYWNGYKNGFNNNYDELKEYENWN